MGDISTYCRIDHLRVVLSEGDFVSSRTALRFAARKTEPRTAYMRESAARGLRFAAVFSFKLA